MWLSCRVPSNLHIAVTAWSLDEDGRADRLARQGELAEAMGMHSFWLPENHFGDARSIPSPLTMLAAVAARTSRIGLGTTSYLLPIRHPLQAAEEVAVLDRLSGGRVILGVGRGMAEGMFRAFDVETRDKRKVFKANLDAMISAWRGEPVARTSDGDDVILSPRPVQTPHPPIWVAAFGPLAIKQAGSLGLPYLASPVETLGRLAENYASHANHVAEAGLSPVATVPVMRTVYVSDDVRRNAAVRESLSQSMGHAMREAGAAVDEWAIIGNASRVRDCIDEHIERLGMTHLIARGRIPGVSEDEQVRSHERLLASL